MYRWIACLCMLFLFSCGKSNTAYKQDIREQLGDLLKPGTTKTEVIQYAQEHGYYFHEVSLESCLKMQRRGAAVVCKKGSQVFVHIEIEKRLNPIESSAVVFFFFDEKHMLESHDIRIGHTFL